MKKMLYPVVVFFLCIVGSASATAKMHVVYYDQLLQPAGYTHAPNIDAIFLPRPDPESRSVPINYWTCLEPLQHDTKYEMQVLVGTHVLFHKIMQTVSRVCFPLTETSDFQIFTTITLMVHMEIVTIISSSDHSRIPRQIRISPTGAGVRIMSPANHNKNDYIVIDNVKASALTVQDSSVSLSSVLDPANVFVKTVENILIHVDFAPNSPSGILPIRAASASWGFNDDTTGLVLMTDAVLEFVPKTAVTTYVSIADFNETPLIQYHAQHLSTLGNYVMVPRSPAYILKYTLSTIWGVISSHVQVVDATRQNVNTLSDTKSSLQESIDTVVDKLFPLECPNMIAAFVEMVTTFQMIGAYVNTTARVPIGVEKIQWTIRINEDVYRADPAEVFWFRSRLTPAHSTTIRFTMERVPHYLQCHSNTIVIPPHRPPRMIVFPTVSLRSDLLVFKVLYESATLLYKTSEYGILSSTLVEKLPAAAFGTAYMHTFQITRDHAEPPLAIIPPSQSLMPDMTEDSNEIERGPGEWETGFHEIVTAVHAVTGAQVPEKFRMITPGGNKITVFDFPHAGIYIIRRGILTDLYIHSSPDEKQDPNVEINWNETTQGGVIVSPCSLAGTSWPIIVKISKQSPNVTRLVMRAIQLSFGHPPVVIPFHTKYFATPGMYAFEIEYSLGINKSHWLPVSIITLKDSQTDALNEITFAPIQMPACRDSADGILQIQLFNRSTTKPQVSIVSCKLYNYTDKCSVKLESDGITLTNVPFSTIDIEVEIAGMCRISHQLVFAPDPAIYPPETDFRLIEYTDCFGLHSLRVSPSHPDFKYYFAGVQHDSSMINIDSAGPSMLPLSVDVSVEYGRGRRCVWNSSITITSESYREVPHLVPESFLPVFCPESRDSQAVFKYTGAANFEYDGVSLDRKYISTKTNTVTIYDIAPGEHILTQSDGECVSSFRFVVDSKYMYYMVGHVLKTRSDGVNQIMIDTPGGEIELFEPELLLEPLLRQYVSVDLKSLAGFPTDTVFSLSVKYPSTYIKHAGQFCPTVLQLSMDTAPESLLLHDRVADLIITYTVRPRMQIMQFPKMIPEPVCLYAMLDFDVIIHCLDYISLETAGVCTSTSTSALPHNQTCWFPAPDGTLLPVVYVWDVSHMSAISPPVAKIDSYQQAEACFAVVPDKNPPPPCDCASAHVVATDYVIRGLDSDVSVNVYSVIADLQLPGCVRQNPFGSGWESVCKLTFKHGIAAANVSVGKVSKALTFSWLEADAALHLQCWVQTENQLAIMFVGGYPPFHVNIDNSHFGITHDRMYYYSIADIAAGTHLVYAVDSNDSSFNRVSECMVSMSFGVVTHGVTGVSLFNGPRPFLPRLAILDVYPEDKPGSGCAPDITYPFIVVLNRIPQETLLLHCEMPLVSESAMLKINLAVTADPQPVLLKICVSDMQSAKANADASIYEITWRGDVEAKRFLRTPESKATVIEVYGKEHPNVVVSGLDQCITIPSVNQRRGLQDSNTDTLSDSQSLSRSNSNSNSNSNYKSESESQSIFPLGNNPGTSFSQTAEMPAGIWKIMIVIYSLLLFTILVFMIIKIE
jgi:hypothetical protein